MPVLTYPSGPLDVNCCLCFNDKDAIIIDPAVETDLIVEKLQELNLTLRAILLTHMHFDHVYGAEELQKRFPHLPIYAGADDIAMAMIHFLSAHRFGLPEVNPFDAEALAEGEYDFGSLKCHVMQVPGHSPGSLAYYVPSENVVFTGDVLFYRSIGRTDLPQGDFSLLANSIRTKLYTLPDNTTAYCGHGLETNIGDEKRSNPFVAAN